MPNITDLVVRTDWSKTESIAAIQTERFAGRVDTFPSFGQSVGKEVTMSFTVRWIPKLGLIALAISTASILLAAPAAQAHVGIGINLGFPPVVVPPVVVAPPVVVGPPTYYAPPPPYYYAPGPRYGAFWYDRGGHRHWRR